jgi:predicted AAA+ superfamily ATPase
MNNVINLSFINSLHQNISRKNGLIQVIIGPRQVGKTTTVTHYFESKHSGKFHYVSADKVFNSNANWLSEVWALAQKDGKILIIDEIQKCENWAEVIKKLWDAAKKSKQQFPCVLLGSSSLEIQKGLTESLTGRFQLIKAHHWNFAESHLGYKMNFEEYLKFGGYPGSYQFKKSLEWTNYVKNSIIGTVIEKDILQFHNVKSPALFRQAFEIIVSYPAQEISYTKLLGQIQERGNVDLVKYYISLFEGALLIRALEKFSDKRIKMKVSSPKILPLAPCLFYIGILDDYSSDERGRAFELIVGSQLVRTGHDLYYWRDGKYEVDFVLKVGRKVFAIEIKSGRKKNTAGVEVFKEKFQGSKSIIIAPENYEEFETDPIEFLEKNAM